jgi:hypothetical protein
MKRFHLFEFEDYSWFPSVIRDSATDYLRFMVEALKYYLPAAAYINEVMKKSGEDSIIDLCSGGGGGMVDIYKEFCKSGKSSAKITLSDKYPNIPAFEDIKKITNGGINYESNSIDATNVPKEIRGVRTMFSAFHHFRAEQAKQILQNAAEAGAPVAFFDGAGNKFVIASAIALGHPFIFFFATPFIKPFKFSRLFYTYIIPVIPITTIWDGIVSALRFYTTDEINELTKDITSYHWETGVIKGKMLIKLRYILGYKK